MASCTSPTLGRTPLAAEDIKPQAEGPQSDTLSVIDCLLCLEAESCWATGHRHMQELACHLHSVHVVL